MIIALHGFLIHFFPMTIDKELGQLGHTFWRNAIWPRFLTLKTMFSIAKCHAVDSVPFSCIHWCNWRYNIEIHTLLCGKVASTSSGYPSFLCAFRVYTGVFSNERGSVLNNRERWAAKPATVSTVTFMDWGKWQRLDFDIWSGISEIFTLTFCPANSRKLIW